MRIFARGATIPPELKIWSGKNGDRKYWLLLPDGSPCPNTKPYKYQWRLRLEEEDGTFTVRSR